MSFRTSPIYQESRKLLQLAIPLASAQLAQALTGFVDTLMMGRLGASTLAAGGLGTITFLTLTTIVGAVVMAVTPLVAEADGAGKRERVACITSQGLWLIIFMTIPVTIIVVNINHLLLATGQDPAIVTLVHTYLKIMAWGCFPILGFMLLRGVVSGLSHARPIMLIVTWGTVLNITGNYILAFGKLGFPRLEIVGLAIASVISLWSMLFTLIIYIIRHPQLQNYELFSQLTQFQPIIFRQLIKLGTPMGVFTTLESGLFAIVTYLMGAINTETLAAHQIVLQTVIIIFMIPLGISFATTIRVGRSFGQQNLAAVKRAAYLSVALGLVFNLLIAIAICLFPRSIIGIYLDLNDPANLPVINLAVRMLTIGVVALILDGMQKILYGALQGIQDMKTPVLLGIPAFWLIGLTTGYILGFNFALGGIGLWIGQSLGLAIASMLFLVRFMVVLKLSPMK